MLLLRGPPGPEDPETVRDNASLEVASAWLVASRSRHRGECGGRAG